MTTSRRLLSELKNKLVPTGRAPRRIAAGLFAGLTMELDLQSQSQLYLGLFERETYATLRHFTTGIASALDIGAAYGEYTLFLLTKTPARHVWAFEPAAEERARLQANLALNHLSADPRLTVIAAFAGATTTADARALDDIPVADALPCFIKLDVDGAEVEVLRGAPALMRRPRVRWLIETHALDLEKQCQSILREAGYTTRIIANAWWRTLVPEQRPIEHNRWLIAARPDDLHV